MNKLDFGFSCPKEALMLPIAFLIFGFCNLTSSQTTYSEQDRVTCTVKGKPLRPGGTAVSYNLLEASYTPGGSLRIKGKQAQFGDAMPFSASIDLFLASVDGPGDYLLGADPHNLAAYASSAAAPATFFSTDLYHTGRLRITKIDKLNRVIVGSFEFKAAGDHDLKQTITVSNGRFILHYN